MWISTSPPQQWNTYISRSLPGESEKGRERAGVLGEGEWGEGRVKGESDRGEGRVRGKGAGREEKMTFIPLCIVLVACNFNINHISLPVFHV